MIKTFRGLLADGGQDRIRLSTIKGKVGYKIIKFELFPTEPGITKGEQLVKIYSELQTAVTGTVNFTDSSLLAAGYLGTNDAAYYGNDYFTIFDNMVFNQDIYITHKDAATGVSVNYYVELEVIPLDDKGAEYMTIKDLRTRGF